MATYKQVNQQTNVVSVGRTAPVPRGQQTKENSLPVVLASDAAPVPVVEQNKIASEVALSLLGIPRAEVALGIFADVNTYDVNPSEWSIRPIDRRQFSGAFDNTPSGIRKFTYEEGNVASQYNWGLTHVPEEAGAMIEAPVGETTTLTSKRFFRYQPGRVSSATFGVKSSNTNAAPEAGNRNPGIRKYGIYDKFDGYYWETRDSGKGDQFGVTRRTQSIIDFRTAHNKFSNAGGADDNTTDYGITGKGKESGEVFESIMNSPIASCSGTTITLHGAASDKNRSFKDGNIPQIGMTIKNISLGASGPLFNGDTAADSYHSPGFKVNTDNSPLFRESTVVTSVATSGNDIIVGLNQAPVYGAIWENSDSSMSGLIDGVTGTIAVNTVGGGANGRFARDWPGRKKLHFSFAGENLIIRDNLPLIHGAIYDPSMLKDRVEYLISEVDATTASVYGGLSVKFPLPASAAGVTADGVLGNTSPHLTMNLPSAFDDSPSGLYVTNIFNVGQIVEYTTDAGGFGTDAQGSLIQAGKNTIFQISAVDAKSNKIYLRNIIERGAQSLSAGSRNSPSEIPSVTNTINTNAVTAINNGSATTKHYIKTPVPWIFPQVEYSDTSTNVADLMFPYARDFGVKLLETQQSSQFTLTGDSHRGSTGGAAATIGLLNTNLTDNAGNITTDIFETYKAEINDLNSGLSCAGMTLGRAYTSDITSSTNFSRASTFATNAEGTTIDSEQSLRQRNGVYNKKVVAGWREWILNNVKPEFYGVYEYKIPRSRFSFDSLNGETGESVYYSDVVKDLGKTRYPGQPKAGSSDLTRDSLWDIDFANVIMKKIEFSWYGAVGALFLAYVPTGTGEARWVRVHHLRCSNQLKTASLGNATLPLTYDVYGGGAPKQQGKSTMQISAYASGKSVSEFITKYGSSYYIDGGDRGTVRLFNYSQPAATRVPQSRLFEKLLEPGYNTPKSTFRINNETSRGRADLYIGSTVRFGSSNSDTARVTWVERQGLHNTADSTTASPTVAKVYLDRSIATSSPVMFDIDTAPTVFGLESKTNIQSSQDFLVRNRVQVYPTKLSVGMTSSFGQKQTVALELKKNVQFQSDVIHNISNNAANERSKQFRFVGTDDNLTLAGSGLPTRMNKDTNLSPNFLVTGGGTRKTITGATQADPVVITAASHGMSNGDRVTIESVGGMTEVNGNTYVVAGVTTNTFQLSGVDGSAFTAYTSGGVAIIDANGRPSSGPYYDGAAVGDKIFGWARVTDGVTPFTLFGRMEVAALGPIENSPIYDFIPEDSYTGTVRFVNRSLFTHANQYNNDVSGLGSAGAAGGAIKGETLNTVGNANSAQITSAITEDKLEIERLSSVRVNNEIRRPIPGTGTKIASLFLENGSEYFDLQPYFDYNKDYISFPLTNIPDNLFLGIKADSPANEGGQNTPQVAVSLTWEEQ